MGVFTYEDEQVSTVPAAKLYSILLKHTDNMLPKAIPVIKSVEIVEGNGGPGTVKKITSVEGGNTKYGLHKVEAIDEANLGYNYSLVGGHVLPDTVEKISFEIKFVAGSGGGCVIKSTIKYHIKGDAPPPEEVLKAAKEKGAYQFKAIEGYILANPDLN